MERQHLIFIVAAGSAFAALIGLAFYNPLQASEGGDDRDVTKVRKGMIAHLRYSSATVKLVQDLPNKNALEVQASSEIQVTNVAGLMGEFRYSDMDITYVEKGKVETIDDGDFKTIEYRFLPDRGNTTRYVYENVDFIADTATSQLIVSVKPLSTAKVGEQYTVKIVMHTGGVVGYQTTEKIIEIVP